MKTFQELNTAESFHAIAADGLDVQGFDGAGELRRAMERAAELAKQLH